MYKKKKKLPELRFTSFITALDQVKGGTNHKCPEHTFEECIVDVATIFRCTTDGVGPIDYQEPPVA